MAVVNKFGILVAQKRMTEKRSISMSEISNATGIPRKTLYDWKYGRVQRFDATVIEKLCAYFGVAIDELLVIEPEE